MISRWLRLGLLLLLLVWSACPGRAAGFRPEKLAELDAAINAAIAQSNCPGGVLWLEHAGAVYHRAYGCRAVWPTREPMTEDTVFDAASLTKVVATTPAVLWLVEHGQVRLEAPVASYLPEFTGGGRESITVRELLTHTSGLPEDLDLRTNWQGTAAALQLACTTPLRSRPGAEFRYSDINFVLLGEIVRRAGGCPLEVFAKEKIFDPLGMKDTGFRPPAQWLARIAPTEVVNGTAWRGVVHDPTARRMGGVAGDAGLFITAADLARYARMLLGLGTADGAHVFSPATVRLMTSVQTPPEMKVKRGLGWDIDSPYSGPRGDRFPVGSYGHTGWTGGSLWIDPGSQTLVIFLSNRNHPSESGNVKPLRHVLGTLAAEAVEN
jgi:CubicO group peptidase (beta-lactamase class C family)